MALPPAIQGVGAGAAPGRLPLWCPGSEPWSPRQANAAMIGVGRRAIAFPRGRARACRWTVRRATASAVSVLASARVRGSRVAERESTQTIGLADPEGGRRDGPSDPHGGIGQVVRRHRSAAPAGPRGPPGRGRRLPRPERRREDDDDSVSARVGPRDRRPCRDLRRRCPGTSGRGAPARRLRAR